VSQEAVRRFWGLDDPIGTSLSRISKRVADYEIIGIAADAMTTRVDGRPTPVIYMPMTSLADAQMAIRTSDPRAMAARVRDALGSFSPEARPSTVIVADQFERQFDRPRRHAALAASVGILALVLSAVGLFGVTAFAVRSRTREICIRLTLGAHVRGITRLLIRDSLRPVVVGLTVGLPGALLAGQLISGLLYGVGPHDPLAIAVAVVILLTAALTAVLVPSRRAVGVDPATILRDL
jgi:predicted lysophospholipase L1 biosynthesis ABC-type transport system permease subunit